MLLVTNERNFLSVEEEPTFIREIECRWEKNKLTYVGNLIS